MKIKSETSDDIREKLEWKGPTVELHEDTLSWKQAEMVCVSTGGHLASFHDVKDWEGIYRSLQNKYKKDS